MALTLTSPVFAEGGNIPVKYTCDGADVSPPLTWKDAPPATAALALIVDDPDAPSGVFTHWVLYNVPVDAGGLPEGVPAREEIEGGARQGRNSWGKVGFGGPCPPSGVHRFVFKLYALDAPLDLPAGASKDQLTGAMGDHVIGEAELIGRYSRA